MILSPMKCRPCYKSYLWGGARLKTKYGKADAPEITAESWELSGHGDGMSAVLGEGSTELTLFDLAQMNKEIYWGKKCLDYECFPILVKLIDAEHNLSIQVHPSDKSALIERGEQGKIEAWYVVDCKPDSCIYYGFSQTMTKDEFVQEAKCGKISERLNCVHVKKGDAFLVSPGTIHAIGTGVILAEVQQSSNTTFRVYDYNRRDSSGKLRPLQIERASEILCYDAILPSRCRSTGQVSFPEFTMTEIASCDRFSMFRLDIFGCLRWKCDGSSFQHLLCIDGEGEIISDNRPYAIKKGESYFMPAALGEYFIQGRCRVLLTMI